MDEDSDGKMISNLPLLFANGQITSLKKMPLASLTKFLPFLVSCLNYSSTSKTISLVSVSEWWPKDVPLNLLDGDLSNFDEQELMILKEQIIQCILSCYRHHGCCYLLKFCDELAKGGNKNLKYLDCCDGSIAVFDKHNAKLLVTCRIENWVYDRSTSSPSPRKQLLSKSPKNTGDASLIMVEPAFQDLYICHRCSSRLDSYEALQAHDNGLCKGSLNDFIYAPEPECDEYDCIDECQFMSFFDLKPTSKSKLKLYVSKRHIHKRSDFKPFTQSYHRFSVIPLSSLLGMRMLSHNSKNRLLSSTQHYGLRYERYTCEHWVDSGKSSKEIKWPITYRHPRYPSSRKLFYPWTHTVCFNRAQRMEKLKTQQTGLTKRSRKLVKLCIPLSVKLKRLSDSEILHWIRPDLRKILKLPPQLSLIPIDSLFSTIPIKNVISNDIIVNAHNSPLIEVIDLVSSDDDDSIESHEQWRYKKSRTRNILNNRSIDSIYNNDGYAKSSPSHELASCEGSLFESEPYNGLIKGTEDDLKKPCQINGVSSWGRTNDTEYSGHAQSFLLHQSSMLKSLLGSKFLKEDVSEDNSESCNPESDFMNNNILKPCMDLNYKLNAAGSIVISRQSNAVGSETKFTKLPMVCLTDIKDCSELEYVDEKSETDSIKSAKENMSEEMPCKSVKLFSNKYKDIKNGSNSMLQCLESDPLGESTKSGPYCLSKELRDLSLDECKELKLKGLSSLQKTFSMGRLTRQLTSSQSINSLTPYRERRKFFRHYSEHSLGIGDNSHAGRRRTYSLRPY